LLIGFLYCKFEKEIEHLDDLWELVNPDLETKVATDKLIEVVTDLFYISID